MKGLKKAVSNEEGNKENGQDQEQHNNPGPSSPLPSTSTKSLKPKLSDLAKHVTSLISIPSSETCLLFDHATDNINSDEMDFDVKHEERELVGEERELAGEERELAGEERELVGVDLQYLNPNFDSCSLSSSEPSDAQCIADDILKEIIDGAFTETCDAVVDSAANEVVDRALRFRSSGECIATDIVNKMVNNIEMEAEEVQIYCEEYKTSGNIIQYLAKGSSLRTLSAIPSEPLTSKEKFVKLFKQVFLPHGFPESVSADYAEYQTWDTLQAFFSTLTGALTTHAVMKGVGVGDSTATAASAAITWLLKDGTGLVGKILFAWWKGTDFDHDCKKWRLFADILNDVAMFLECLTPHLRSYSIIILCTSTAMKSLVGVAGGATRAALTQHQAIQGNMADVSAKDGSQEACVSLFGSFVGIFLLLTVADGRFKWDMFIFFVFCHIMCNYRAVKAVQMATLNIARFVLIVRCYLVLRDVGSVKAINRNESVFIGQGLTVPKFCGYDIKFGVSMLDVTMNIQQLNCLRNFYGHYNYLLHIDGQKRTIYVFLKRGAVHQDILQAFYHAMLLGIGTCMSDDEYLFIIQRQLRNTRPSPLDTMMDEIIDPHYPGNREELVMSTVGKVVDLDFPNLYQLLENKGWNTRELLFVVDKWRGEW